MCLIKRVDFALTDKLKVGCSVACYENTNQILCFHKKITVESLLETEQKMQLKSLFQVLLKPSRFVI